MDAGVANAGYVVAGAPDTWLDRHRTQLLVLSAVTTGALLWWALDRWQPLPERNFVMAVDSQDGAYAAFGEQYREILARDGVNLELRPIAGAEESFSLLQDPASGVMAAFLLGGTVPAAQGGDLVSLGAVFYEPLWLFTR